MRAVSAIAIVVLHTFQYSFSSFAVMGKDKILSVVIRNDMLWAVPVFVMVTGALMLDKDRELSYSKLFGKYIKKIVILLLVCIFASRALDEYVLHTEAAECISMFLTNSIRAFLTGQGWGEFWYLYLLLGIYISLPAFKAMINGMSAIDLKYIFGTLFVFQSIIPFIFRICDLESGWYILFFSVYPFYLIAGYYLSHRKMNSKLACLGFLVCLIIQTVLTIDCFLYEYRTLIKEIELYSFPLNAIMAIFVFCICKE